MFITNTYFAGRGVSDSANRNIVEGNTILFYKTPERGTGMLFCTFAGPMARKKGELGGKPGT